MRSVKFPRRYVHNYGRGREPMRRLSGHAEAVCDAPTAEVFELLRALEGYPSWAVGLVRRVEVLERDRAGAPTRALATLRVAIGPLPMSLELTVALSAEPCDRVTLRRLPNDPHDDETFVAMWQIDQRRPSATTIRLEIEAGLDIPRLVPLGDTGDRLARELVEAAAAAAEAAS